MTIISQSKIDLTNDFIYYFNSENDFILIFF